MTRWRVRMVDTKPVDAYTATVLMRVLPVVAAFIPAWRRRALLARANRPTRMVTAIGDPRWWQS